MFSEATILDQLIRDAGIPIDGISGPPWRVNDFRPEATEAQRLRAQEIIDAFVDVPESEHVKRQNRREARSRLTEAGADQVMLRGILRAVKQSLTEVRTKLGLPIRSWQQMIDAIRDDIDAGNCDG